MDFEDIGDMMITDLNVLVIDINSSTLIICKNCPSIKNTRPNISYFCKSFLRTIILSKNMLIGEKQPIQILNELSHSFSKNIHKLNNLL